MATVCKEAQHASGHEEVDLGARREIVRCDPEGLSQQSTGEFFYFPLSVAS
jgi:hypothetical protein